MPFWAVDVLPQGTPPGGEDPGAGSDAGQPETGGVDLAAELAARAPASRGDLPGTTPGRMPSNLAFAARLSLIEDTPASSQPSAAATGTAPAGGDPDAPDSTSVLEHLPGEARTEFETALSRRQSPANLSPEQILARQAPPAADPAAEPALRADQIVSSNGSGESAPSRSAGAGKIEPAAPTPEAGASSHETPAVILHTAAGANPPAARKPAAAAADSRPVFREPEDPKSPVVRDLSVRFSAEHEKVDVRLYERGGEIRVAVRTPDADLARGLRSDLSHLAGRLESSGYRTEIWRPAETEFSQSDPQHHSGNGNGGPRQDSSGSGSDWSQGNQQQREQRSQPRWLEEMAHTLRGESSSSR